MEGQLLHITQLTIFTLLDTDSDADLELFVKETDQAP